MNLYVLTLLVLSVQQSVGDFACGKLDDNHQYYDKANPRLEDYAWLGRVYGSKDENVFVQANRYLCTANLISQRHLLTSVFYCARNAIAPAYVVFGRADYTYSPIEYEAKYVIGSITIHPNYKENPLLRNDIAIIRLARDVVFKDYVQPICLPPMSRYTKDYTDEYLQIVGHSHDSRDHEKLRSVSHILPTEKCVALYRLSAQSLCASTVSQKDFSTGSALMDVSTADPNNKTLHIIGTLSFGSNSHYYVFMKITNYINWINSNIKYTY